MAPSSDWVRNVLAAGHARLTIDGEEVEVASPRLVDEDEAWQALPDTVKRATLSLNAHGVFATSPHGSLSVRVHEEARGIRPARRSPFLEEGDDAVEFGMETCVGLGARACRFPCSCR
jgi:hypothetical protein